MRPLLRLKPYLVTYKTTLIWGLLTVIASTVYSNTAVQFGGGIHNNGEHSGNVTMTVSGSTLNGNSAHVGGGARTARGGFPAAKNEQLGFVETGDRLDSFGQCGGNFGSLGETAGRAVEGDQLERDLLRDGHHHLLELGLRAEADEPDFAAGRVPGEVMPA